MAAPGEANKDGSHVERAGGAGVNQAAKLPCVSEAEIVDRAIVSRRSIRAFLPTPVPLRIVEEILRVASRAPSGSNIQPWRARVLLGVTLAAVTKSLLAAHENGEEEAREYDYYPSEWRSPYIERRRKTGWGLYELAGVQRGDREAAARQRGLNYTFFGAPVGMIFTIDSDMGRGSWLDFGMFLQNIMLAARGRGLDTCPQAAMANYPAIVRRHLAIPDTEMVVCGMALGHADPDAPTNRLMTDREELSTFVTVYE